MTLEEEVVQLRAEVQMLRALIAELQEQNTKLREQLAEVEQHLAEAEQRLAELEQGKKGTPAFVKANKPQREGAKAPRRRREKEDNHGRKRAEQVTRREEHHVERCPDCGSKVGQERVAWRREVIELPPPPAVEVTEHVVYKARCAQCGEWKYATPPGEGQVVGRRRLGVRLMALIGYLSESLRLPCREIQNYLQTMHGLRLSVGAIEDLRKGLAEKLQPVAEELKTQIRSSAIVHADETGWREDGQNGYVWVFSTPGEQGVRYYVYEHSRGQKVVTAVLGEEFKGVLGSDFYAAYNVYTGRHQRCWPHLLGDLHDLKAEHPADNEVYLWAQALHALHDDAQAFVQDNPGQSEREKRYVTLVHDIEELGLLYAQSEHPCQALAKRLLRHQDELFQFVLVAGLRADNNLAERSLRPLVVVRKISGGTRSPAGSQTRMTLASVFGTWKARALNPFLQCLSLLGQNSWL